MKLFLIFCFIVFCAVCYAAGVQNKNISVELTDTGNNNLVFSKIENIKTGVNFITSPDDKNSLWTITMRKGVKAESEITLKPQDSEKAIVENKKDTVKITWTNVRNDKMKGSVDVIVTGRLEGDNSYWKIRSVNNSDYGYWSVNFPNVTNIDVAKENLLTNPNYGGRFEKGLEEDYDFPFPSLFVTMQWQMITKNNTTLYMATEDTRAITKQFSCNKTSPDNMKFSVSLNPENMGVAGVDYEQPYEVNISAFEGDWYDGCKKYRKWGIENKYANFGKGKIENRKDLPQWYKELPVWLRQEGFSDVQINRIIDFAKYLDVPVASHTYYWSQYGFDTHYPDILPAQDIYLEQIKKMHDANIKVMPYTNGQMADLALGNFAKEKNKEILIINEEGSPIHENWPHAIAQGADNYVICTGSEYIDFQIENFGNIAKDLGIDALYVDEVCAGSGMPCFNWRHNHPMGGSYFRVEQYNRLFDNARGEMNKYVNDGVIITSESGAEPYTIDGWLRCNECDPMLDDCAAQTVVHSGYATSFGFYYYPAEFTNDNAQGAINKTAIALSKGYQLGWGFGWIDYNEFPLFAKYIKCACKARHKAYKYFNLGEMVRNVKITSELPKKNCYYQNFALEYNLDYPAVRTCSHNYKGKTAVTFTNIINEKVTFDWESFGKGLGLKDKKSYKISEFYPNEKEISKGKEIKGTVTLEPLETKILIIE